MKKVLILLAEGFEEIEALGTADILRRMGLEVVLAAMKKETVSGSHNITVTADAVFDKVDKNEFDAVVLPGGLPGSLNLYNDDRVIDILHLGSHDMFMADIVAVNVVYKTTLTSQKLLNLGLVILARETEVYKITCR